MTSLASKGEGFAPPPHHRWRYDGKEQGRPDGAADSLTAMGPDPVPGQEL